MKRALLLFTSILFLVQLSAQVLKGRIVNSENEAIPYVSIFIKEAATGTTANENGIFEIKIPQGTYTCTFQHLGYETLIKNIAIPNKDEIVISLTDKIYDLPNIIIGGKNEDPAYNIMRKAIGMAPFYRKQLSSYKAEVYIKGTLKIDKISALAKRVARKELNNVKIKEGETYLQESVSEISYKQGKVNQKIISLSNSFPEQVGDVKLGLANYNIYSADNSGLISPVSSQAFSHYKFEYEGFSYEGNHVVNKIKVTPKYKNAISFTGHIFIVEKYWSVHSFVLKNKQYGIEFTNKQTYGELTENVWMPISNKITADVSIMGNKGAMDYISSVKYKNFVVNPQLQASINSKNPDPSQVVTQEFKQSAKSKEISKKIEEILSKDELKNSEAHKLSKLMQKKDKEDKLNLPDSLKQQKSLNLSNNYRFEVDSTAKSKERAYWDDIRPIPLMKNEKVSYVRSDSIKGIVIKNDTLTKINKKNSAGNIISNIVFGKNYKIDSSLYLKHSGLINIPSLEYNVVDGFVFGQTLSLRKTFKDTSSLTLKGEGYYAFARKKFMFNAQATYNYLPEKLAYVHLATGNESADFSSSGSLSKLENSINSLVFRRNYKNYFENQYVRLINRLEIVNGFIVNVGLSYHNREKLENNTDFSFFYKNDRDFRDNIPEQNPYVCNNTSLVDNQKASIMTVLLSYTPEMYYYQRGKYKISVRSKYPTFSVLWKKGFKNVFNSTSNFDQLEAAVRQTINLGAMETFKYSVVGGYFPNNKQMHFRDFKSFNIKEFELVFSPIGNNFNLLKTYMPNTNEWYTTAYFEYSTPYLALKRLPVFNKTLVKENVSLIYLNTPYLKHYTELGYTLSNIGLIGSVGVFVGFEKAKYYDWGFKASIAF